MSNRQADFFWGAVIGGAIATLTSLLFTTKKGKQIQRQVGDMYDDVEDSVKDFFADSEDKIESAVENVGKKVAQKAKSDDLAHARDSK